LRDDVEIVLAQERDEALTQQRQVLGDYDSVGNLASNVVPSPGVLASASVAPSASIRPRSPVRPEPAGSAPPRPSSATRTNRSVSASASRT
jgi:hypothetical protein